MRLRYILLLFHLISLLNASPNYSYTIRLSQDLRRMFVRIDIRKTIPLVFTSGNSDGKYFIDNIRVSSVQGNWGLQTYNGKFYPRNITLPAKISYEVDLNIPSEDIKTFDQAIVVDPGVYFWRPEYMDNEDSLVIHLELPNGMHASVPWDPIEDDGYLYQQTPLDWPGLSAFGRFPVDTVQAAGTVLHIANPNSKIHVNQKKMRSWLRQATKSVAGVYGQFPIKNIQILLMPVNHAREAVPFAMVIRNGGVCVEFFIDASRPLNEFVDDWTATHELSHSLLPFVDRNQAWLSEGMATYYQYVLMARDGRLTHRQAWERILSGFDRGRSGAIGESLEKTSADMSNFHSFRNVYWSGAAMMLRADNRLRQLSNNKYTLDDVLKAVQLILEGHQSEWSGMEMMQLFDRISGTTVFMNIYNRYVQSGPFPADDKLLRQLGIVQSAGKIRFNDNAPAAAIRKAIVSPRGDHHLPAIKRR